MNVALVGSNFALRGYLPVLKKIKQYNVKIISSRSIEKIKPKIDYPKKITFEKNWKKIFKEEIDLIILAVPPKIQQEILIYNLKFKKKIIFEKPISKNYSKSKSITNLLINKKIKSEINLTYINHDLFKKVKDIIDKKKLGKLIDYNIKWNFVSYDLNKKIKSWKTDEKLGGGIKNIFLTHVFSYCEYFFGFNKLLDFSIKTTNFKNINYKHYISCSLVNSKFIKGKIEVFTKNKGHQNHIIKINFTNGLLSLSTNSKDWTKDFILKLYSKKTAKTKLITSEKNYNYSDGRCNQIYIMLKKFLKTQNYNNLKICLNAERINNKLK